MTGIFLQSTVGVVWVQKINDLDMLSSDNHYILLAIFLDMQSHFSYALSQRSRGLSDKISDMNNNTGIKATIV
jgi:hypothetical protein